MTWLIAFVFLVLGMIIASFAAVMSERIYTGQSWVRDRSRCNSCAEPLHARDLVPVLSWLATSGRARCCGTRVTGMYAAGETVLGVLFALSYLSIGLGAPLVAFLAALSVLAFIVLYDLRHTVVPPLASTALILLSGVYALLVSRSVSEIGLTLIMAGAIGLCFWALHAFSRGRAMGLGDAPVALALTLLIGPYQAIAGLLFSFWIGAVIGIVILVSRPVGHRIGIEVPFVPFLALGYLLAFFTQWNPLSFGL